MKSLIGGRKGGKAMKGQPLRMLLVEDNEDHAEIIRRSFKANQAAIDFHHVADGQAALDYLMRRGEYRDPKTSPCPDVILLDLRLPKMDGLEVLKEIKGCEDTRKIPIVVLTSSKDDRDVAEAYECHANSYLVKPLDFNKFTQLMRDLGFYWLGWNVSPFQDFSAKAW